MFQQHNENFIVFELWKRFVFCKDNYLKNKIADERAKQGYLNRTTVILLRGISFFKISKFDLKIYFVIFIVKQSIWPENLFNKILMLYS